MTKETGPGGRSRKWRAVWAVVGVVAGIGILGSIARLALARPEAANLPKAPPKAAAQPDLLMLAEASASEEDTEVISLGRWVESDQDEAVQVIDFIQRFFGTPPGSEKKAMMRPVFDLDALLAEYAGHPALSQMPPQRIATKVFFGDNGLISTDANILGYGFRPIVVVPGDQHGEFKIDFESFIGHNGFEWPLLPETLKDEGPLRVRAIAWVDPSLVAKVPGDVILSIRDPDLTQTYHAHLSIIDIPDYYLISWLRQGVPLAFTLEMELEDTLFGEVMRVSHIAPDAWYSGGGGPELKLTP